MTYWFDPFSYIDLPLLYLSNPLLWDALIYMLIFLGLSQFVFRKAYEKRYGKIVGVGVGLLLTFSMVMFEFYTGLYIGSYELALLPVMILHALLMYLLYQMFHELFGMPLVCSVALAYFLVYAGLAAMFDNPYGHLGFYNELFEVFLILLNIIALITLIICITRLFSGANFGPKGPEGELYKSPARTERERRKEKKPSKDPSRLQIQMSHPYENNQYNYGQPIQVIATINGGSGKYEWYVSVDGHAQVEGRQRAINITLNQDNAQDRLPEGEHTVEVYARDRKFDHLEDRVSRRIIVGGDGHHAHGVGSILGRGINERRHPMQPEATYTLFSCDADGNPGDPVMGPVQATRHNNNMVFKFENVPPGMYRVHGDYHGFQGIQERPDGPIIVDESHRTHDNVVVMFAMDRRQDTIQGNAYIGPAHNSEVFRNTAHGARVSLFRESDDGRLTPVHQPITIEHPEGLFAFPGLERNQRYRISCEYRDALGRECVESSIFPRNPFTLRDTRGEPVRVHVHLESPFILFDTLMISNHGTNDGARAVDLSHAGPYRIPPNQRVRVLANPCGFSDNARATWQLLDVEDRLLDNLPANIGTSIHSETMCLHTVMELEQGTYKIRVTVDDGASSVAEAITIICGEPSVPGRRPERAADPQPEQEPEQERPTPTHADPTIQGLTFGNTAEAQDALEQLIDRTGGEE